MSSGIFYPAVSGDDGYAHGTGFTSSTDKLIFGDAGGAFNLFIRFVNVVIPQGSIIIAAYMRFTAYSASSAENLRTNIYFNDVDDASAPTSSAEYNNLAKTTAFTPWDDIEPWTTGGAYNTPNLVDELQEVVNRDGFSNGNAAIALILDDGSPANIGNKNIRAFDYGSGKAELHVEWGPPPAVDEIASWNNLDAGSNITFSSDLLTATHA